MAGDEQPTRASWLTRNGRVVGVVAGLLVASGVIVWLVVRKLPQEATAFDADEYIAKAWSAARDEAADAELISVSVRMLTVDGRVDTDHGGRLEARFRSPSAPGAAPAEPAILGANTKPSPAGCPVIAVDAYPYEGRRARRLSFGTTTKAGSCDVRSSRAEVRCKVAEVWQRAIAKGAPQPALADVELVQTAADGAREWRFTITERGEHYEKTVFSAVIPDDCRSSSGS